MTNKLLVFVLVLGLVCVASATRVETFDTDLGQFNDVAGTRENGQDWGWSNTNNAGGTVVPVSWAEHFNVRTLGLTLWIPRLGHFNPVTRW